MAAGNNSIHIFIYGRVRFRLSPPVSSSPSQIFSLYFPQCSNHPGSQVKRPVSENHTLWLCSLLLTFCRQRELVSKFNYQNKSDIHTINILCDDSHYLIPFNTLKFLLLLHVKGHRSHHRIDYKESLQQHWMAVQTEV